ncbi:MAG: 4Fe-4S binding protein [Acidobacteria bacterium]|nr:4Fe-4S binding protein [Acidobacteriota bacterium]
MQESDHAAEAAPARSRPPRRPALPPVDKHFRPLRKRVHLACFLGFVILPFTNLMRVDIPRQRFFFAGFELWINEFGILFFATMLLMFLVAAMAIVYGRIYCSYACPQMIFSEASQAVERWVRGRLRKLFPKWPGGSRETAAKVVFYAILLLASVFLAFVFTAYFVDPKDLASRLLRLDVVSAGGITGASVTLLTFLDFAFVRQKFCTTVCPYGYIQGMLQDPHTLLVVYQDPDQACIECKKCVTVCEMGIDIRKGPYQIECVHCGDCIDACEDVLRKVGHEGLIRYAYGEHGGQASKAREPLLQRLGFRDGKRFAILLVLLFYVSGLGAALSMRRPVLVQIAPDRSVLFENLPDGRIGNRIRIKLANRSSKPVTVRLWTEGLPGAELDLPANPVSLDPGAVFDRTVLLKVRPWSGAEEVNPLRILAQTSSQAQPEVEALNFILPAKGSSP